MEPIFKNRFVRTTDIESELYLYLHITSPSSIACLVILGVVTVVNLVACLMFGMAYANMAVFAMCIIVLFVLFYRYYSAVQIGKKRFAESTNNRGEITVTAALDGEDLISESSDRADAVIVPYADLKRVFVTKNYYMIQTNAKLVYVFRKGCFTAGKEEDFLPYVRQVLERSRQKSK